MSSSISEEASVSSSSNKGREEFHVGARTPIFTAFAPLLSRQQPMKRRRNLPGNPDPDAEVIALSPKTLMATNRFICEICNKGFQRDQNLQLHRRGHNLPWKLRQRTGQEIRKKVYVCPEPCCVHHEPSRALGDLTGIKKHFCRKHGERKWKCEKCSKRYAVQSDWKAHIKACAKREYRCDCGTVFSRKDSFITHRAFCNALAEENARPSAPLKPLLPSSTLPSKTQPSLLHSFPSLSNQEPNLLETSSLLLEPTSLLLPSFTIYPSQHNHHPQEAHMANLFSVPPPHTSATALLQKVAEMGAILSNPNDNLLATETSTAKVEGGAPEFMKEVGSVDMEERIAEMVSVWAQGEQVGPIGKVGGLS
ncbi:zinc finger protein ENHYDROUS-like [Nymphaea colorata]|nr:zinc finger protein ENHYDROUS-like [Nymphaea colorata]